MKIYVYYIFQFIFVYIFNPLCITILLSGDILYKSMFFFDFIKFLFTFSYFATFVWKKNRRKGTQEIWNWICTVIRKYLWATFQRSLIPPLHFPYIFLKQNIVSIEICNESKYLWIKGLGFFKNSQFCIFPFYPLFLFLEFHSYILLIFLKQLVILVILLKKFS